MELGPRQPLYHLIRSPLTIGQARWSGRKPCIFYWIQTKEHKPLLNSCVSCFIHALCSLHSANNSGYLSDKKRGMMVTSAACTYLLQVWKQGLRDHLLNVEVRDNATPRAGFETGTVGPVKRTSWNTKWDETQSEMRKWKGDKKIVTAWALGSSTRRYAKYVTSLCGLLHAPWILLHLNLSLVSDPFSISLNIHLHLHSKAVSSL